MSQRKKKAAYNPRKVARDELRRLLGEIFYVQDMFIIESGKLAHALDELQNEDTRTGDLKVYNDHQIALAKAGYLGLADHIKTELNKIIVEADAVGSPLLTRLENEKWDAVKEFVLPVELRMAELSTDATIAGQKYTGLALEIMETYFRNVEFVKRDLEAGSSLDMAKANLEKHIAAENEKAEQDAIAAQAAEQAQAAVSYADKGEKLELPPAVAREAAQLIVNEAVKDNAHVE